MRKLLSLEPIHLHGGVCGDLDRVLSEMGKKYTAEELAQALKDRGIAVSVPTLYRWKRDIG